MRNEFSFVLFRVVSGCARVAPLRIHVSTDWLKHNPSYSDDCVFRTHNKTKSYAALGCWALACAQMDSMDTIANPRWLRPQFRNRLEPFRNCSRTVQSRSGPVQNRSGAVQEAFRAVQEPFRAVQEMFKAMGLGLPLVKFVVVLWIWFWALLNWLRFFGFGFGLC